MVPHGPMKKPIVFHADRMHTNEWAGLNAKKLKKCNNSTTVYGYMGMVVDNSTFSVPF